MGLFDNLDDPKTQALLMMGLGLLGGAPGQRKNFGADLSHGLMGGMQAYQGAKQFKLKEAEEQQQRQVREMQLAELQRSAQERTAMQAAAQRNFQPGQPQMQPTDYETPSGPQGPGKMNVQGYMQDIAGIDPMKAFDLQSKIAAMQQKNYQKLGEGESLYDMTNPAKPIASGAPKLPTGMVQGPNGPQFMPEYLKGQQQIRAASRPQVNVNTREETEFAKKMGANYAEQYDGILKGGMGAQNKLRDMQRFDNIVSKVPTGKLEPLKAEVAKLANGLGVKVDTEKLGFQEALESMANQYALTLRNPSSGAGMPGALSDKDREFLVNMVPGLAKTGTGNKLIIEGFRRVAQREIEIAALAREYKSKTGKFDDGFYAEVEKRFGGKDLLGDLYQQASSQGAQNVPMSSDPLGIRR